MPTFAPNAATIIGRAAGVGSSAEASPMPVDAEEDGTDAALRIMFDPTASFASKKRAFRVAVRMIAMHEGDEDAEESVEE